VAVDVRGQHERGSYFLEYMLERETERGEVGRREEVGISSITSIVGHENEGWVRIRMRGEVTHTSD
jgi:hypothetical protein